MASHEEGVIDKGVDRGGCAGVQRGNVGAVRAVVPVNVGAEGGRVADADGQRLVAGRGGIQVGIQVGAGLHVAVFVDAGFGGDGQADRAVVRACCRGGRGGAERED